MYIIIRRDMAKDVIARLRVENQQWDEGMRRAQKGVEGLQKSTGGMDAVMGKAMKSVGAMAAALATVEAAGKAFNKTIGGSQTLTDAWGRTMQAATRVTDSFFESLSRGSFQEFLSGMDGIIAKAREAYDAIDALGTYDIFAGPLKAKYEAEIRKLKYEIRAGIGDTDAKKGRIREIENDMLALAGRESTLSGSAASKLLESFANARGGMGKLEELFMSGDQAQNVALKMYEELKRSNSKTAEYDKVVGTTSWGGTMMGKGQSLQWSDSQTQALAEALRNFGEMGDEQLREVARLYVRQFQAQARVYAQKMENLETLRYKGAGGGGGAKEYTAQKFDVSDINKSGLGLTTSMAELEAQLAGWQQKLKEATTSAGMQAAEAMTVELQRKIDAQPIALRLDVPEESIAEVKAQMQDLSDKIRSDIKPLDTSTLFQGMENVKPLKNTEDQVEKISSALGKTTEAFGTMGNAMQMIDDPATKVAGLVMQAVANVASSFAQALSGARDPWTWMAAAIGGTATMISTIAAIKSATAGSYADGGVVRGGAFAGDAVPIMANAGEVVLNAAQQGNLAGQLQPRDMGSDRQPYLSGEMIFLGLNNHLRRSGRGEMVTSR